MIPLPIRDVNPTKTKPVIVIVLVILNAAAWLFELSVDVEEAVLRFGAIPAWILGGVREGAILLPRAGSISVVQDIPHPFSILTAMFMHGSWAHILGNMWFLWIFGDNVEEAMGQVRFTVFYLICGVLAAAAQIAVTPASALPMVGASGAIAGVLGGYALLFPRARVHCIWILIVFITTVDLPAAIVLGLWFISQFFIPTGASVATMAHVGGFVAGLVLVKLFARR